MHSANPVKLWRPEYRLSRDFPWLSRVTRLSRDTKQTLFQLDVRVEREDSALDRQQKSRTINVTGGGATLALCCRLPISTARHSAGSSALMSAGAIVSCAHLSTCFPLKAFCPSPQKHVGERERQEARTGSDQHFFFKLECNYCLRLNYFVASWIGFCINISFIIKYFVVVGWTVVWNPVSINKCSVFRFVYMNPF